MPHWKGIEELGNWNDIFPMKTRIPYSAKYRYLGNDTDTKLEKDVSWESAIRKAKRLEIAMKKALKGAWSLPIK